MGLGMVHRSLKWGRGIKPQAANLVKEYFEMTLLDNPVESV
jgi:hypothetical protein